MHIAYSNISPIVIFSRKSNTNAIADPYCTVYSARRTSTTAVGHATHVRRTSTTLALKGLITLHISNWNFLSVASCIDLFSCAPCLLLWCPSPFRCAWKRFANGTGARLCLSVCLSTFSFPCRSGMPVYSSFIKLMNRPDHFIVQMVRYSHRVFASTVQCKVMSGTEE